ncbi:MAG: glycogen debranching protein [Phycisphaerae bacterium]|nr:glycogen debranching protein [Phycisphaerae bacterium]
MVKCEGVKRRCQDAPDSLNTPLTPENATIPADPSIPAALRDLAQRPVRGNSPARDPLWTEWVLTNGLGGFAMGSATGIPLRRYHGLLIASLRPPVSRVMLLSALADAITLAPDTPDETTLPLTPFHFRSADNRPIAPNVHDWTFERCPGLCRWTFEFAENGPRVEKTLVMADAANAISVTYRVLNATTPWRLTITPLIALRDFHSLLRRSEIGKRFTTRPDQATVTVSTRDARVRLAAHGASFEHDESLWNGFEYVWEEKRGMDCAEDLFAPGRFIATGGPNDRSEGLKIYAQGAASERIEPSPRRIAALDDRARRLERLGNAAIASAGGASVAQDRRWAIRALAAASDEFVVTRRVGEIDMRTVVAGYPWFSDWGRDTMISLPGLMLVTGRHAEAFDTLRVFARHRRRGLIPNRFDDYAGAAHYNTVDAPLWFLHAAAEYVRTTGDTDGYRDHLAPACLDIIRSYRDGTDHAIRMDPADHLITAGDERTQLTWMDAQRDGVTFTPRFGKAVEINALWGHGLLVTAALLDAPERDELLALAEGVRASFTNAFNNPETGALYDRLEPHQTADEIEWRPVAEIRPNQIFAVSLEASPLDPAKRVAVLDVVRRDLLTRHGLRTLAPSDPNYRGVMIGDMFDRDGAYHNGTAWPWLIGPYAEAVLRVGDFSPESRAEAVQCLAPLVAALDGPSPGTIAEIYDGDDSPDDPQRPDGCFAQAWSVAETLRALVLACAPKDP